MLNGVIDACDTVQSNEDLIVIIGGVFKNICDEFASETFVSAVQGILQVAETAPVIGPLAVVLSKIVAATIVTKVNSKNFITLGNRIIRLFVSFNLSSRMRQSDPILQNLFQLLNEIFKFIMNYSKKGWLKRLISSLDIKVFLNFNFIG